MHLRLLAPRGSVSIRVQAGSATDLGIITCTACWFLICTRRLAHFATGALQDTLAQAARSVATRGSTTANRGCLFLTKPPFRSQQASAGAQLDVSHSPVPFLANVACLIVKISGEVESSPTCRLERKRLDPRRPTITFQHHYSVNSLSLWV